MHIISHRGFWKKRNEQNKISSFRRSFENLFGIETDIRDSQGEIVISHDLPTKNEILLEELFLLYKELNCKEYLFLNIKSDGLQNKLKDLLVKYDIKNYFVFDMSIPDCFGYVKNNLSFFTRKSELEESPIFLDLAKGLWLDEFYGHWIKLEDILTCINNKKHVCIVSPELHNRSYEDEWSNYKIIEKSINLDKSKLMICTDYPLEAMKFFNE